jgi:hypothetical protein
LKKVLEKKDARRLIVSRSQMMQQPSEEAEMASAPVLGLTMMLLTEPRWSFMLVSILTQPQGLTCESQAVSGRYYVHEKSPLKPQCPTTIKTLFFGSFHDSNICDPGGQIMRKAVACTELFGVAACRLLEILHCIC